MRIAGSNRCSSLPLNLRQTLVSMATATAAAAVKVPNNVIDLDGDNSDDSSNSTDGKGSGSVNTVPRQPIPWTENLIRYSESRRNRELSSDDYSDNDDEGEALLPPTYNFVVINVSSESSESDFDPMDVDDDEVEMVEAVETLKDLDSVLQRLGSLSVDQVKKLIEDASNRLRLSLENLKMMGTKNQASLLGTGGVVECSALGSGNFKKVEQEKDNLLRLLIEIKKQHPGIFSPQQIKQLDDVARSFLPKNSINADNKSVSTECKFNTIPDISEIQNYTVDLRESENASSGNLGQPDICLEAKVSSKLPSTSINVESHNAMDASKTSSSIQQRYDLMLLSVNPLPSPTPSEEFNENGKHSSDSSAENKTRLQQVGGSSGGFRVIRDVSSERGQLDFASKSGMLKAKANRRDPRFNFKQKLDKTAKNEIMGPVADLNNGNDKFGGKHVELEKPENSSKRMADNKSSQEEDSLKRQRNRPPNSNCVDSQPSKYAQFTGNVKKVAQNLGSLGDRKLKQPGGDLNSKGVVGVHQVAEHATVSNCPLPTFLDEAACNSNTEEAVLPVDIGKKRLSTSCQKAAVLKKISVRKRKITPIAPERMEPIHAKPCDTDPNGMKLVHVKPDDPRRSLQENVAGKNENPGLERNKSAGVPLDIQSISEVANTSVLGGQSKMSTLTAQPVTSSQLTTVRKKGEQSELINSAAHSQSTAPSGVSQNVAEPILSTFEKLNPTPPSSSRSNVREGVSGLCSEGGTNVASQPSDLWGDVDHFLDGFDEQQKSAIRKERARRIEEQNKMFSARKLCLVLDLDHTLLNSVKFEDLSPVHEEMLKKREEHDKGKPHRHIFCFPNLGLWTKLRPGIWNFLEKASKIYEMHVYTMGNRLYANEMAKLLDPTGVLFAGRVIARGDDTDGVDRIKDLDGVLGMESAVVIIDDTAKVWPHHISNLITVERYAYFPCSRRQFGLPGPSLLEIDRDERAADGTLASAFAVIERIHRCFFSHQSLHKVDVRKILASEQRKVLAGCRILFSRVIPVGETSPHLHPLWRLAEQFGAACTNEQDEQVTHVVAASAGTNKVNWALSTNRFVVRPSWVEASAFLYRRVDEKHFAIKPKAKAASQN